MDCKCLPFTFVYVIYPSISSLAILQRARARAERQMRRRDQAEGRRRGRLPRALGLNVSDGKSN